MFKEGVKKDFMMDKEEKNRRYDRIYDRRKL